VEREPCRSPRRAPRTAHRPFPRLRAELLEQGARLRIGPRVQLPVDLRGRPVVPARRQRLHQRPLCRLPCRIHRHCTPQVALGCPRLFPPHRPGRQSLQRPQIGLLPVGALLEDPLLGAPLQERAAIEGHGSLPRGGVISGDASVEGDDVDLCPRQVQREGAGCGRAEAVRLGAQRPSKISEADAEDRRRQSPVFNEDGTSGTSGVPLGRRRLI
jgi:hypothetical protein